jgi:HPt (histidine-containing phosphotransfer) domain-containing protein
MDMQMPVMDGVEATCALRGGGYDTPIVALTANVMKEERDNYTRAGCNAFLGKPVDTNIFYETLARFLKQAPANTPVSKSRPRTEFDDDLFELTEEFIDSLPGRMQSVRDACQQAEWKNLASEAHKLKGIAGSFGFPVVTQQAAAIEQQVKQGEYGSLGDMLVELEALCDQAIMEFRQYASMRVEA